MDWVNVGLHGVPVTSGEDAMMYFFYFCCNYCAFFPTPLHTLSFEYATPHTSSFGGRRRHAPRRPAGVRYVVVLVVVSVVVDQTHEATGV